MRVGVDTFSGQVNLDPIIEARPAVGMNDVCFRTRAATPTGTLTSTARS